MKTVKLVRTETSKHGTFGRISIDGRSWFTGELPWRDNSSNLSCIPGGTYSCRMTMSPRFGMPLYLVDGVAGRTGVRIHPANLMGDVLVGMKSQLHGCIALGEKLGWMDGQKAVLVSRPAVTAFERLMQGKPFYLEVNHVG